MLSDNDNGGKSKVGKVVNERKNTLGHGYLLTIKEVQRILETYDHK